MTKEEFFGINVELENKYFENECKIKIMMDFAKYPDDVKEHLIENLIQIYVHVHLNIEHNGEKRQGQYGSSDDYNETSFICKFCNGQRGLWGRIYGNEVLIKEFKYFENYDYMEKMMTEDAN